LALLTLIAIGTGYGFVWTPTLLILGLIGVAAEWMIIQLPQGNSFTTSFVVVLLALVLPQDEPPQPVVQAIQAGEIIAFSSLLGYGLLRRQSLARTLFYTAHYILVSGGAGLAFVLVNRQVPPWGVTTIHVPAVAAYILVYALLSQTIITLRNMVILSPTEEKFPKTDLLVAFLLTPLPLLAYYLYTLRNFTALLIILIPLFAVLAAFRTYINIDTAYDEVSVLYEISQAFMAAMVQEETARTMAQRIARGLERLLLFDACLIYGLHEEANEFRLLTPTEEVPAPRVIQAGRGLLGQVLEKAQGQVINDVHAADGDEQWPPKTALLVMPLVAESRVVGLLVLVRFGRPFTAENFRLLSILAPQAGAVLRNAQLFERSQQLAETDRLVGLMNKAAFMQRAQVELGRLQIKGGKAAVILADIDDFRRINNTYGHPVGDQVLKGVAQVLRDCTDDDDLVARYGGEEFVIMLVGDGEAQARQTAECMRQGVEEQALITDEGQEVRATISLGVAFFPEDGRDMSTLVKRADRAAYLAKRTGKNRVCLYEERDGEEP